MCESTKNREGVQHRRVDGRPQSAPALPGAGTAERTRIRGNSCPDPALLPTRPNVRLDHRPLHLVCPRFQAGLHPDRHPHRPVRQHQRGCGGGELGVTGGGDTDGEPAAVPGYVVDCTPEIQGDPMVCITKEDWNCSQRDFYVRESICALLFNGVPSEYDGKPQMSTIDLDGKGPQMPVGEFDCVNLPEGVLSGYQGLLSCDDCRVCGNQLEGYNSIGYGKGYGWDDLAFCPDNYEALGGPGGLCAGRCSSSRARKAPGTGVS